MAIASQMDSAMDAHDELAALLAQHLTFKPDMFPNTTQQPAPIKTPNYSASQHYTHSAWTPRTEQQQPYERPSSEPRAGSDPTSETILRNHGVDPSTLTPAQVSLFKIADSPQKRRLLELWSICPPNQGGDIPALAWSSTTVEHEEQLARLRYERTQQHQFVTQEPEQPLHQTSDGTWSSSSPYQSSYSSPPSSEPYMSSGYEELMRRDREREERAAAAAAAAQLQTEMSSRGVYQPYGSSVGAVGSPSSLNYSSATDPVYLGPDYARERQQMEMAAQYGSFEHFRSSADNDGMAMDVM